MSSILFPFSLKFLFQPNKLRAGNKMRYRWLETFDYSFS